MAQFMLIAENSFLGNNFTGEKLAFVIQCTIHEFIINNVGRTLLLGLPRKQNGHPIGYIMLLSDISPLKRGVQRL